MPASGTHWHADTMEKKAMSWSSAAQATYAGRNRSLWKSRSKARNRASNDHAASRLLPDPFMVAECRLVDRQELATESPNCTKRSQGRVHSGPTGRRNDGWPRL